MPACVANIVYKNSWVGQTSSIPAVNVFTASSDGMFMVSVGVIATGTYPPGGAVYAIAEETASGQNVAPYTNLSPSGTGEQAGSTAIVLSSGQSIQYSATISGSVTSFNAYVVIEQLM